MTLIEIEWALTDSVVWPTTIAKMLENGLKTETVIKYLKKSARTAMKAQKQYLKIIANERNKLRSIVA